MRLEKSKVDDISWQCKLVSFLDKTNNPVNNWKNNYVGKKGIVYFNISEYIRPGEVYAFFYPDNPDKNKGVKDVLITSLGECELKKDGIILTTENSVYRFELYPTKESEEYKYE